MKSILLICFLLSTLVFGGCNQKTGGQTTETGTANDQTKKTESTTGSAEGGHDYTFLTIKMLQYKAALVPGRDPKEQPYAGHWIKMDSDGTFRSGIYDKQTHTGKWTYNHDATTLLLQPDGKEFKASEWKILFNDDMIVFVGTATYGDGGTQIQLVRIDKYPEKQ